MAVKGSAHHSMRIVPHRPVVRFLQYAGLSVLFVVSVVGSFYAGIYYQKAAHKASESVSGKQDVVTLRMNAEVDRQTIENMRQQMIAQKAQSAATERDVHVYKDLLAGAKTNPLGISFGAFTLSPSTVSGNFTYTLVVQKLAATEAGFLGSLDFRILGEQAGKSILLPLYQVSDRLTSPTIGLDFKYFQTVEGEFSLPTGFTPSHVQLTVKSADKKKSPVTEIQLEWLPSVP